MQVGGREALWVGLFATIGNRERVIVAELGVGVGWRRDNNE